MICSNCHVAVMSDKPKKDGWKYCTVCGYTRKETDEDFIVALSDIKPPKYGRYLLAKSLQRNESS